MTYEGYLESEQALRDLNLALSPDLAGFGVIVQNLAGEALGVLGSDRVGAWTKIRLRDNGREEGRGWVPAYFRAEDDLFIVTDLGEAVRALRLRTGLMRRLATYQDP